MSLLVLPVSPAAAATNQILYGADGSGGNPSKLYILNPTNGAVVSTVGDIGFAITGMALDPTTGILYGATSSQDADNPASIITIDRATGAGSLLGALGAGVTSSTADIEFAADGTLYGWSEDSDELVTIDKATGAQTIVGPNTLSTYGSGLAIVGGTGYLAGDGANGELSIVDLAMGATTPGPTLTGDNSDSVGSLAVACDGTIYGDHKNTNVTPRTTRLLTVDQTTGAVTYLGTSVSNLDAIEFACPGSVQFASEAASVDETAGSVTVTVSRVDASEGPVSVQYSTADGTAVAGSDYSVTSGTLTFANGETTKTITVPITSSTSGEDDETFRIVLSAPTGGATVSEPSAMTVTIADTEGLGYRMVAADGGIFTFGDREFHGSTGDMVLNKPIVGGATDASDNEGYWIVASDGGVFTFNAEFHGSLGGQTLTSPAVEIEPTPTGKGYWIVLADGKVYTFGDADHFGDMAGKALNKPVIGMSVTPTGKGYWLVAEDGGIFNFGDAGFFGSMGDKVLNAPVIDLAPSVDNQGYFLLGRDGGVFTFGSADFKGSTGAMTLNSPVIAMLVAPNGAGYWLAASDGGVFTFGSVPFLGSMGGTKLNSPVLDLIA